MCAYVCPPCRAGLDLRGRAWRLAKGWGPRLARLWLQRMSSVYKEMKGGQRQLLSLCTLNHTHHTHTLTLAQRAVAVLETPQALQCVYVFVLQLAAGTSGSDWQTYTHQAPQLQLSMVEAECVARLVDADWPGQLTKVMHRELIRWWVKSNLTHKLLFTLVRLCRPWTKKKQNFLNQTITLELKLI